MNKDALFSSNKKEIPGKGVTMELKPCPFCGGDGSITFDPKSAIIFGSCWECGARSEVIKLEGVPTDDNFSAALEAWNRRCDNG